MMKTVIFILFALIQTNLLFGQSDKIWQERCITNNEFEDRFASYSPDGAWIAFESNRDGNWEIYVMDAQGENVKRLTFHEGEDRRPSWHPNGKKILFESNRSGVNELYLIRLGNRKIRKLKYQLDFGEPVFASYSPDGKQIALSLKQSDQNSNIALLSRRGKMDKILIENGKRNFYPRWSNDGKALVYFSRKDTDNQDDEIYRIDIANGVEARLTNWETHNFCPSWSFDDSQIVYVTSIENGRPEIFIMDKDGNNKTQITHNEDGETLPNWHPTENKILISAYRNGHYQICELYLNSGD